MLRAAAIIDTAALKAQLVESASAWPLCSLTAALHNYGPAIRSISVLMQPNPQASLPLATKEDLQISLRDYRIYLGDLPEEPEPEVSPPPVASPPPDAGKEDPVKEEVTKTDR